MARSIYIKFGLVGIIAIAITMVACTGPQGPAGDRGPQGPPGPSGQAQAASDIFHAEASNTWTVGGYGDNFTYEGDQYIATDGYATIDVNDGNNEGLVVAQWRVQDWKYDDSRPSATGTMKVVCTDFFGGRGEDGEHRDEGKGQHIAARRPVRNVGRRDRFSRWHRSRVVGHGFLGVVVILSARYRRN